MDTKSKKFEDGYRTVIECNNCDDRIYSYYDGQYLSCNCGSITIDETSAYCNIGYMKKADLKKKSIEFMVEPPNTAA